MNYSFRKPIVPILLGLLLIIVASCARKSTPTGGPKDVDPPVPLQSKPVNYSTNFNEDKIIILFDEYVKLNNVRNELLISPPLPEQAEIKQRSKNLVIKLNNELEDSTTYSLNFYNAIEDLNEGNLLKNFTFEFSTGDTFDSLYIGGFMKNAFNYESEAGLYVGLYENMHDSTPRKTIPKYVAKTDEEGNYYVTNLKNKPYYIFGLKDFNNNLMFDLPNEGIAFLESAFNPSFELVEFADSLRIIESISENEQDTVWTDSVHIHSEWVTSLGDIALLYFYEDFELQYFRDNYRTEQKQVVFSFNRELSDSFSIRPIKPLPQEDAWYIDEPQLKKDSLVLWLTDSTLYNTDSLFFELNYTMIDSNKMPFVRTDTILSYFEFVVDKGPSKQKERKERRQNILNIDNFLGNADDEVEEDTIVPSELILAHNASMRFDLNKPVDIISRFPITQVTPGKMTFYKIEEDTILIPVNFVFEKDSLQLKHYTIAFEKDEDEVFQLLIPAGTFADIYGNTNDSLLLKIKTLSLSNYATLKLHVEKVQQGAILQLINGNEEVVNERKIWSDTIIHYEYLKAQKVNFKLYYDANNNGKWDTGNFKDRKQPEEVLYFPQELELLDNMDFEYTWDLYPMHDEHEHHEH